MNAFIDNDWKKKAAATAVNEADTEKVFCDMAYGFVENKVGDLMKDDYRLGFEIVKKNDENTRMVGIFAFKVDKELLFAPVFFLNGEIKGPMLYRCSTKTFIPATKEWASYLIDAADTKDGKGRERSALNESAPLVQMHKLTFRPSSMQKSSSGDECCPCCGEKECKCVSIKPGISVPDVNGTYRPDKDYNTKPGQQPKLSTGDSVLKMASRDDCQIHLQLGDKLGVMTQEDAENIKSASSYPVVLHVSDDTTFNLYPNGIALIKQAFFSEAGPGFSEEELHAAVQAGLAERPLAEFLREPDFGKPAADAIMKAAGTSKPFAKLLAERYLDSSELIPEKFASTEVEKKDEGLSICYDVSRIEKSAEVQKRYFENGFYVLDKRPVESMSVVFEDMPDKIEAVNAPGVYSLLKPDGSYEEDVLVAPYGKRAFGKNNSGDRDIDSDEVPFSGSSNIRNVARNSNPIYVGIKGGKIYSGRNLIGVMTGSAKKYGGLVSVPSARKVYMVLIGDKLYGPIAVTGLRKIDGVTYCDICSDNYPGNHPDQYVRISNTDAYYKKSLIINPDVDESDVPGGVLGKDAKFVQLAPRKSDTYVTGSLSKDPWKDGGSVYVEPLESIGIEGTLENWIYRRFNTPKVSVLSKFKDNNDTVKKASYVFSDGERKSRPMNKVCALVKLARDMEIPAPKAYEILDKADENGEASFYLAMQKQATRLRLAEQPIFDEEFDSEFGVPVRPTQEFHLKVHGDQMHEPPASRGDMLNPTSVTGLPNLTVVTTAPEELRALADTYNLANVFEHAAVGTLANTFNALPLIDKYIPKLEGCLDSLGRIKFLMFWRPGDFEAAYGEDDMNNLEAEVDSNFEALGALLLKLLKKADKQRRKNVDFSSDAQQ